MMSWKYHWWSMAHQIRRCLACRWPSSRRAAPKPAYHRFRTDKPGNPGGGPCGSYEESRRSWQCRRWGMARQIRNRSCSPAVLDPEGFSRGGMEGLQDHGRSGGGGCDAKSETPPGSSVSMIAGSSRSLRLKDPRDHGSRGGGAWRDKSEIPGPITPPFMILKDFPEGLWKILHDHGSGGRGTVGLP